MFLLEFFKYLKQRIIILILYISTCTKTHIKQVMHKKFFINFFKTIDIDLKDNFQVVKSHNCFIGDSHFIFIFYPLHYNFYFLISLNYFHIY